MSAIEPELAAKLMRSEYPEDMAARSCTCEAAATCGAHRLLTRYMQMLEQMRKNNERHREYRNQQQATIDELRAAGVTPSVCLWCGSVAGEQPPVGGNQP